MTRKKILKLFWGIILFTLFLGGLLCILGNTGIDKLPNHKTTHDLRIVSMNVSADNILSDTFQDHLIQTQADIIVVIEWTGNNVNLNKFTKAGYHTILNHPRKKVHGICILSKLEGIATILEAPIKTPCTLPLAQFRFQWHDKYITLFAVHAPPPVSACKGTTTEYIAAIADWVDDGKLSSSIGVGEQGDHLIMAGDFNSLAFEGGIKKLKSKSLTDVYTEFNLIAPTWKPFRLLPYIARIDYILFSPTFSATSTSRFVIDHSDHLGLLTDLTF